MQLVGIKYRLIRLLHGLCTISKLHQYKFRHGIRNISYLVVQYTAPSSRQLTSEPFHVHLTFFYYKERFCSSTYSASSLNSCTYKDRMEMRRRFLSLHHKLSFNRKSTVFLETFKQWLLPGNHFTML